MMTVGALRVCATLLIWARVQPETGLINFDQHPRLLQQFNAVLETRDTARGLVVNMSDVLFDTGKHTLRPMARDVRGQGQCNALKCIRENAS